MKRVILHIGTEKTATTSLQRFCAMNREALSARGIWYPSADDYAYCSRDAHFPLAASLFDACPDFITRDKHCPSDALFGQLAADILARAEDTVLLSAEHFSSRCSIVERVERIRGYLAPFDVRVIVYVRPQHELLISAYSEHIKNGGLMSIEEMGCGGWVLPKSRYFNYRLMLQPWVDAFGPQRICLRVFQPARLRNGDIYDDFLWTAFGIDGKDGFATPARALNTMISMEAALFLYHANRQFPPHDENRRGWEAGQVFRAEAMSLFPQGRPLRQLLTAQHRSDIARMYDDDNRALAMTLRPDLESSLFVSEPLTGEDTDCSASGCFSDAFVRWIVNQWKMARTVAASGQTLPEDDLSG